MREAGAVDSRARDAARSARLVGGADPAGERRGGLDGAARRRARPGAPHRPSSMPPATAVPPSAAVVATAAPAPSCGAPEIRPAAMPGTKMARPNTAMAARMVEAACVSVISPVGRISVPNSDAPMPTTMASTISLMPEEMTLPSTRSARKAVWPNSANGTSTKPASTVSLNSMMVMKSWTDEHEEGEQHDQPGQQQHDDGHEVGEERGDADQLAGLLQQRPRRGEPGRGHEPRPHQVGRRQRRARRLQPEPGEGLEDDVGEALEVVEQQGEEADVEHLADQLRRDVVLAHQRPEQPGQRDVDGHQHAGQEGHVAGEQPEAGVDVAAEGLGEAVDDGEVVHVVLWREARLRRRRQRGPPQVRSGVRCQVRARLWPPSSGRAC